MDSSVLQNLTPEVHSFPTLLRAWEGDSAHFIREDAPKIVLVVLAAFILIRLLRAIVGRVAELQSKRLPQSPRMQQVRTLAGVINSVAAFVILFVATLEVLSLLGLNLGPLLASAGIAGLAIGFGAQTLVKDVINGFFILLENQYDVGDTVRIAGVKGVVESMSLRHTRLRDDDGTVHIVPNSSIQIVSNLTRDWSQFPLKITVAYSEPSDKIVKLLKEVGEELRHDPLYASDIVGEIRVPGIDRVGNGEAEYLMLVKTLPLKQYPVSRELRRRIKGCFHKNNIQAAGPGRVYVMEQGPAA